MRWLPLVLLAACSRPPEPVQLWWVVEGVVLDADGEPVGGALVSAVTVNLNDNSPGHRIVESSVHAGEDGRFRLPAGVDDDSTFLVARKEGYAVSDSVHMADVAANDRKADLRLGPAVEVTVVVHGTPSRIYWETGSPGQGGRFDIKDEATITDMPPGEVQIGFLSREGFWEVRTVVATDGLKLHFQKQTAHLLEGVVVDRRGKPIEGAYVLDQRMPSVHATTDADGHFKLMGAPRDEHTSFLAVAPGYARTWTEGSRIVLVPSVAFKGRVTDTDGRPLVNARVVMRSMDDPPFVTATIDQGHFFFDHGRPKEEGSTIFGIAVEAPGYKTHDTGALPIDEPGTIDLGVIELEKLE